MPRKPQGPLIPPPPPAVKPGPLIPPPAPRSALIPPPSAAAPSPKKTRKRHHRRRGKGKKKTASNTTKNSSNNKNKFNTMIGNIDPIADKAELIQSIDDQIDILTSVLGDADITEEERTDIEKEIERLTKIRDHSIIRMTEANTQYER